MKRLLLGFALASAATFLRPEISLSEGTSSDDEARILEITTGAYRLQVWLCWRSD